MSGLICYDRRLPMAIQTCGEESWPPARTASSNVGIPPINSLFNRIDTFDDFPLTTVPPSIGGVPVHGFVPSLETILLCGQANAVQNGLYGIMNDISKPNLLSGATHWGLTADGTQAMINVAVTAGTVYFCQSAAGQTWYGIFNGDDIRQPSPNVIIYAAAATLTLYASASLNGQPVIGTIQQGIFVRHWSADQTEEFTKDKIVQVQSGTNAGRYRFRWSSGFTLGTSPAYFDRLGALVTECTPGYTQDAPSSFELVCTPQAQSVPPSITEQPKGGVFAPGEQITLRVGAVGSAPFAFQWKKNDGQDIPGATLQTFTVPSGTGESATYWCVVSNPFGIATSMKANVQIGQGPVIQIQPKDTKIGQFNSVSLEVGATGAAPLAYQWFKDGVPLAGKTASSYTIENVLTTHAGSYTCLVSNQFGQVTSNPAVLTVGAGPGISQQPTDLAMQVGNPATFTVVAFGDAPLTYNWFKDNVPTGITTAAITIAAVIPESAGKYKCVVSNDFGTITTRLANLNVVGAPSSGFDVYLGNAGTTQKVTYTSTDIQNLDNRQPYHNHMTFPGWPLSIAEIASPTSQANEYRIIAFAFSLVGATDPVFKTGGSSVITFERVQDNCMINGVAFSVFRTTTRSAGDFTMVSSSWISAEHS